VNLEDILDEIVGREIGTILSCIPGKLAFVESEDGRFILEK
jgi:Mg2+/Co2+ transporter CorB